MKKIAIIGAGPGGLAAGMVLSGKGYDVHIFEKDSMVGGRSKRLTLQSYQFDVGPTFLMYIDILKEVFSAAGYDLEKEVNLIKLDQLYRLVFKDVTFDVHSDPNINKNMYDSYQKGMGKSYEQWLKAQEKKMSLIQPILEKPFPNALHFFRKDVLKALPVVHPFQSVFSHLKTFNKDEHFIHSLSFQAKYLGMASYDAPSMFTILPYLEHAMGLYHVEGGLNQINQVMEKLIKKNQGHIHLKQKVEQINVENGIAKGLIINGKMHEFDSIILNADFAYAMNHLIKPTDLKKYQPKKLNAKKFSVSTFMLYLGLNHVFDFPHHEILFSNDYETYLKGLTKGFFTDDLSIYVHNPSMIDKTLAPSGHSSVFILVPVPNLSSEKDYKTYTNELREKTIDIIEKRHQVDLRKHIKVEHIITPENWENDYHVHLGAVFNLAHNLGQMLHKRPHNQFEDVKNIYLVGGGTHPGSGLPTIYQSALILKHFFK